ncbi:MAG: hypothetical protein L0Y66_18070 [Myxococcaceae bacterium]|nr:hypothetical protein [Myxococcaceae bacterium]MCI0672164.1 hypothetical protein [Myxococcaceae bacterium]
MNSNERLREMPRLLVRVCAGLDEQTVRRKPEGMPFALVEHAWHLADLEREGFGTRLHRLLDEEHPSLPDFPGDRIALERHYLMGVACAPGLCPIGPP